MTRPHTKPTINCIYYKSQIEKKVSTSTTQAECYALLSGAKCALYFAGLLRECGINQIDPVTVWCDNQSAIKLTKNPVMHDLTRHFRITLHFIQQLCEDNYMKGLYVTSELNFSDLMTKAFDTKRFMFLKDSFIAE